MIQNKIHGIILIVVPKPEINIKKLYWLTTEDHDEDWFVVASSAGEACKFHEDAEGYAIGDATAEEILSIPENIPAESGWPSDELLVAVGAKFIMFISGFGGDD